MPTLGSHGGQCCGLRHYYGFTGDVNNNPDIINGELTEAYTNGRCQYGRGYEVVLTAQQIRAQPETVRRLADLGFVLVGRFHNENSGNICVIFHRLDHRRSLAATELGFDWPGMSILDNPHGDLPRITRRVAAGSMNIQVGDVVDVYAPGSALHGETNLVVSEIIGMYGTRDLRYRFVGHANTQYRGTSLRNIRRNGVLVNPEANPQHQPHPQQRHPQIATQVTPRPATVAQVVQEAPVQTGVVTAPTVVASFFAGVSMDGRRGGLRDSLPDCVSVIGRRTRIDKLQIMSDGTRRWVENVPFVRP